MGAAGPPATVEEEEEEGKFPSAPSGETAVAEHASEGVAGSMLKPEETFPEGKEGGGGSK